MSKLAGLRAAHELLTISRNTCARGHLLEWKRHPDDKPYQEVLIETSFLLVEIEDLIQSLEAIAEVCQHVLAGTVPIDHYLEPAAFDPWAVIDAILNDEFLMPVNRLTPRLTAWLEARPQLVREATAKLQKLLGGGYQFWVKGEDGHLRPPTDEEHKRAPETDMLKSMEQTFFTMTYTADLAEVAALTESRGDLERIAALVA
jgi:hypothetical protein